MTKDNLFCSISFSNNYLEIMPCLNYQLLHQKVQKYKCLPTSQYRRCSIKDRNPTKALLDTPCNSVQYKRKSVTCLPGK